MEMGGETLSIHRNSTLCQAQILQLGLYRTRKDLSTFRRTAGVSKLESEVGLKELFRGAVVPELFVFTLTTPGPCLTFAKRITIFTSCGR